MTQRLLKAAARCSFHGNKIFKIFLALYESDEIGQSVYVEVINQYHGIDMLQRLTDRFGLPMVTKPLLRAAASISYPSGYKILNMLLAHFESDEIEESVFVEAAGNQDHGMDMLQMLIDRFGFSMLTEPLLRAVARDGSQFMKVVEFLSKYPNRVERLETDIRRVITSILDNSPETIVLLLKRFPNIEISKSSIQSAISYR